MRRIVTAITAAAMALSLVSMAIPANAVAGYDSAYAGESAFLTLNPGQTGTFTVFFQNTGTTSWAKGTATQVDLAACLEDKVTCNSQDASEAPFSSGWLSTTRYATATQTTVAPGSIGTFTYNVAVPAGQAAGTYRFNGALVLSGTGADIHNEGYYQDVTVPSVAGSCAPTAIALAPSGTSNATVGSNFTLTATATCTDGANSVGTSVTFFIQSTSATPPNPSPLTLTGTTGSDGKATATYTRANPDIETAQAYPTANPALRSNTATIQWAAAQVVTVTPKETATLSNTQCRTYTVTLKSSTTGAAVEGSTALRATFTQKRDGDTTTNANATINGVQPTNDTGVAPTAVELGTTNASGQTTFTVCGTTTTATPIVWREDATAVQGNPASTATLASTEFRDTGGATTFSVTTATTLAVTPDTTATITGGGQRVFTIAATDQAGAAFTGAVFAGTVQNTDTDLTNNNTCTIAWYDNDTSLRTTPTTAGTNGTTASGAAKVTFALNTSGQATFALTCPAASTGTPIAWQDLNGDTGVQTGEPQDTGGATVFSATAAVASATMTFSSRTIAASSSDTTPPGNTSAADCPNGDSSGVNACWGEVTITFTLKDAGGNTVAASQIETVNYSIQNTGSRTIYVHDLNGGLATTVAGCTAYPCAVAAGTTVSGTATIAVGASTSTIKLENVTATLGGDTSTTAWASGKVTATLASNASVTGSSTVTWVVTAQEPDTTPPGTTTTAAGTVVRANTTGDVYIVQTSIGYMRVTYDANDTFVVAGTATTMAAFEDNISTTDVISFSDAVGADTGTVETHNITTNN